MVRYAFMPIKNPIDGLEKSIIGITPIRSIVLV